MCYVFINFYNINTYIIIITKGITCIKLTFIAIVFSSSGVLACLDGYMNIAMEQTEEYVDGQLKSKYGDCFIRGNNGK